MDSKFYVSLEAAKLLKEKGRDDEVTHYYDNEGKLRFGGIGSGCDFNGYAFKHVCTSAPTKAEVIDWLERKKVYVEIHGIGREENRRYCYTIFSQETGFGIESKYIFPTRLEAEEAAIIKALELL